MKCTIHHWAMFRSLPFIVFTRYTRKRALKSRNFTWVFACLPYLTWYCIWHIVLLLACNTDEKRPKLNGTNGSTGQTKRSFTTSKNGTKLSALVLSRIGDLPSFCFRWLESVSKTIRIQIGAPLHIVSLLILLSCRTNM